MNLQREAVAPAPNFLGLNGIEFVEYATTRPHALGQVVEKMGFKAVARHRSREVIVYRQGTMNLIINGNPDDARVTATADGEPVISAVAFRVKDAGVAFKHCMDLGAWDVPSHAQAMELHIPGIHGPGPSRFFFVDKQERFSIYDVDFDPIPGAEQNPKALSDFSYFGVVQYIGLRRTQDWEAFYSSMFGFTQIPENERFGILPKGSVLRSPCGTFLWQLVEPSIDAQAAMDDERLQRIAFGTADVPKAVSLLSERGVGFIDSSMGAQDRGALTRLALGSVAFELVHRQG